MNQNPPADPNLPHDLIPAPEDSLSVPATASQETTPPVPETPLQATFNPPATWSQDETQTPTPPEPTPIYPSLPQSPTSPQSVQSETQTPVPPQTKSSFLRYFLITVALILLGILIGVLAARFLPLTPAATVPATPTPSILLTPSVTVPVSTSSAESVSASTASGEVLGWKTYSSSSLGYSLKYPQNTGWYVDEGRYTTTIYNYDVKTASGRSYDPVADKGKFKVEIASDSSFKNCDLWLSDYSQTPSASTNKIPEITSLKRIVKDKFTGLSFETESMSGLIGLSCFNNPNGGLLFLNGFLDYPDFKTVYSQIISSVSFTASGTSVTQ